MFALFQKGHQQGLPVPDFSVTNNTFKRLTLFDTFYFGDPNKFRSWNTLFNIGKLKLGVLAILGRSRSKCGSETDRHIVSDLFEKTVTEFVPQAKADHVKKKTENRPRQSLPRILFPLQRANWHQKNPTV
ncbi:unnamed protein product [Mucor hiemalis]